MEEDMRKLNITEVMAEDRKQWRQHISCPTPGVTLFSDTRALKVLAKQAYNISY